MAEQLPGQVIGRYRLIAVLGEGGAATVFRAVPFGGGAEVAVKVLAHGGDPGGTTRQRFMRETFTLATLAHPNIVKVSDYGEQQGRLFYVMPLFPGGGLDARLARGRTLDPAALGKLGLELLAALRYLHGRGYVHRDVKPGNIMFDEAGTAILMDFGFVRPGKGSALTRAGTVVGTPRYLSPEAASGQTPGVVSDLYQLGLVLYEAAAGRPAYPDDAMPGLVEDPAKIPVPPPPSKFNARVKEPLAQFLLQAVEWRRERRFPGADAMSAALRKALSEQSIAAPRAAAEPGASGRTASAAAIAGKYDLVPGASLGGGADYCEATDSSEQAVLLRALPRLTTTLEEAMRTLGPYAGVEHRALGRIRDLVAHKGQPILVFDKPPGFQFLEAPSAGRAMARSEAARIVLAVLVGLDQLHGRGLVHGDVRLQNVMTGPDGGARLLGHGVDAIGRAGLFEKRGQDATSRVDTWMAPEVQEGAPATPASDVYSAGRLLMLLIQGRLAPGPVVRIDATEPFAPILNRATAADPADRFAEAGPFAAVLRRMVPAERVGAAARVKRAGQALRKSAAIVVQKVQERRPWFIIVSAVGSLVLILLARWLAR